MIFYFFLEFFCQRFFVLLFQLIYVSVLRLEKLSKFLAVLEISETVGKDQSLHS